MNQGSNQGNNKKTTGNTGNLEENERLNKGSTPQGNAQRPGQNFGAQQGNAGSGSQRNEIGRKGGQGATQGSQKGASQPVTDDDE